MDISIFISVPCERKLHCGTRALESNRARWPVGVTLSSVGTPAATGSRQSTVRVSAELKTLRTPGLASPEHLTVADIDLMGAHRFAPSISVQLASKRIIAVRRSSRKHPLEMCDLSGNVSSSFFELWIRSGRLRFRSWQSFSGRSKTMATRLARRWFKPLSNAVRIILTGGFVRICPKKSTKREVAFHHQLCKKRAAQNFGTPCASAR